MHHLASMRVVEIRQPAVGRYTTLQPCAAGVRETPATAIRRVPRKSSAARLTDPVAMPLSSTAPCRASTARPR